MVFFAGKEKEEFFSVLGGRCSYSTQIVRNDFDVKPPRLFYCNSSKTFHGKNCTIMYLKFHVDYLFQLQKYYFSNKKTYCPKM